MKKFLAIIGYTIAGIIIAIFFIGLIATSNNESSTEPVVEAKAEPEPEKRICDTDKAKELFDGMLNDAKVFKRISEPDYFANDAFYRITVNDSWYGLDFDYKSSFDSWVRCHLSGGLKSKIPFVTYLDRRTGKEIASSSSRGFSLE